MLDSADPRLIPSPARAMPLALLRFENGANFTRVKCFHSVLKVLKPAPRQQQRDY